MIIIHIVYLTIIFLVTLNTYESSLSNTYVANGDNVSIKCTDKDMCKGYFSQDTIYIDELQIENQTFAELTNLGDIKLLPFDVLIFCFNTCFSKSILFFNILLLYYTFLRA